MSSSDPRLPEQRLADMGLVLPAAPAAVAAYVPAVRSGSLLYTAGQLPVAGGAMLATGHLGDEVDLELGIACARQCAINVLAQVRAAVGTLDLVEQLVKLTVFVASTPTFTDHHLVANGASELLAEVFGDAGQHVRSAVGVAALPMGAPVEIDAILALT